MFAASLATILSLRRPLETRSVTECRLMCASVLYLIYQVVTPAALTRRWSPSWVCFRFSLNAFLTFHSRDALDVLYVKSPRGFYILQTLRNTVQMDYRKLLSKCRDCLPNKVKKQFLSHLLAGIFLRNVAACKHTRQIWHKWQLT